MTVIGLLAEPITPALTARSCTLYFLPEVKLWMTKLPFFCGAILVHFLPLSEYWYPVILPVPALTAFLSVTTTVPFAFEVTETTGADGATTFGALATVKLGITTGVELPLGVVATRLKL